MPTLPWSTPTPRPANGEVTVLASRLVLRRLSDVPAFFGAALRIRKHMLASPGALGLSLIARPLGRSFWTLSAWQDPVALRGAAGHELHRQVMSRFGPKMAGSAFVTWTVPATSLPVEWDEARRRLEQPDTVHGQP